MQPKTGLFSIRRASAEVLMEEHGLNQCGDLVIVVQDWDEGDDTQAFKVQEPPKSSPVPQTLKEGSISYTSRHRCATPHKNIGELEMD